MLAHSHIHNEIHNICEHINIPEEIEENIHEYVGSKIHMNKSIYDESILLKCLECYSNIAHNITWNYYCFVGHVNESLDCLYSCGQNIVLYIRTI